MGIGVWALAASPHLSGVNRLTAPLRGLKSVVGGALAETTSTPQRTWGAVVLLCRPALLQGMHWRASGLPPAVCILEMAVSRTAKHQRNRELSRLDSSGAADPAALDLLPWTAVDRCPGRAEDTRGQPACPPQSGRERVGCMGGDGCAVGGLLGPQDTPSWPTPSCPGSEGADTSASQSLNTVNQ